MTLDCVVDASVGIKLFVVEDLSDRADALFALLTEDPPAQFYVPDLFFIECANVLWKYVRRFGYAAEDASQDVMDLTDLPLHTVATRELAHEAVKIAIENDVSAYDAAYVALSGYLTLPLITADQSLALRLERSSFDVRWLGAEMV
jgi:predicted nucleic acid-binding protein